MKKITIITVNYRETKNTEKLILSLEKIKHFEKIQLLIADNSSTFKSREKLKKIISNSLLNIELFTFKKNLFYWPAAKKIISKKFKLKDHYTDWLMICNNDIVFNDQFFLEKLFNLNNIDYHLVGPRIINSAKKDLNPFLLKPMSKKRKLYWKFYFKSYYFSRLLKLITSFKFSIKSPREIKKIRKVYAIHGSAMIFSKHFFLKGGMIDDNFKLFGEEITTAEICKIINCKIFYVPNLTLRHNEHSTTKKINDHNLYDLAKRSHYYFSEKYNL